MKYSDGALVKIECWEFGCKVRTLERNAMRSTIAQRAVIMPVWTVTMRITVNIKYEMIPIPSPVLTSNDLVHNIVRLAEPSPMFTLYVVTRVQCSMFFQQHNTQALTDESQKRSKTTYQMPN